MTNLTRRDFLLGTLGVTGTLGIVGCSDTPANQDSGTQEPAVDSQEGVEEEPQEEVTKYAVGDTVETDLVRLTLNNAAFTIALNNELTIGTGFNIDNDYFCPKEYDVEEDSKNPYVAPKGSVLVFFELLAENLDRDYLALDEGPWSEFIAVTYDGNTYTEGDFEEKEYGWSVEDIEGAQDWDSQPVSSLYLSVGVKELNRGYVEAPFEPSSLTDPFEIAFNLPRSDGEIDSFTFAINQ